MLRPGRSDADGHRRLEDRAARGSHASTPRRWKTIRWSMRCPRRRRLATLVGCGRRSARSGSGDRRSGNHDAAALTAASAKFGSPAPAWPKVIGSEPRKPRNTFPRVSERHRPRSVSCAPATWASCKDGELFVTGRLKDLIIIRGRNHYPQDIEHTVEKSHPLLRSMAGAAFTDRGRRPRAAGDRAEIERGTQSRSRSWTKCSTPIRRERLRRARNARRGHRADQGRQHSQNVQRQDSAPRLPQRLFARQRLEIVVGQWRSLGSRCRQAGCDTSRSGRKSRRSALNALRWPRRYGQRATALARTSPESTEPVSSETADHRDASTFAASPRSGPGA